MATRTQKVVLITGATSGIGRAAASSLAAMGATVIVAGRSVQSTEAVRADIARGHRGDVHVLVGDLSSLAEVRRMADETRDRFPRLDVLINNAGIDTGRHVTTVDGFELTFAVNYLAPFVFTTELIGLLSSSRPSRILNVASSGHR